MKTPGFQNKIIGIYGVSAVGKTVLTQHLTRVLTITEVQSTDSLKALYRTFHPEDPMGSMSSYLAWTLVGPQTERNVIKGFLRYRNSVAPLITALMQRAMAEQFTLIFDGIHFSPALPLGGLSIPVVPILLTIDDESAHKRRIHLKASGRTALEQRLMLHFDNIRLIQTYLLNEAKRCHSLVIDTGKETVKQTVQLVTQFLHDS